MRRCRDWRTRLNAAIDAARRQPFDEESAHCAFFAADCVAAMTGTDLAARFRGMSRAQGTGALVAAGYADHVAFAATYLEEVHPSRMRAGDVAVVPAAWPRPGDERALGIVVGGEIVVRAPRGLGIVPLAAATRAFRVP